MTPTGTGPSQQEVWEEFRSDPLFADLDMLGDLRILHRAVRYVARNYPEFEGARRLKAIRNAFMALGGHYSSRNAANDPQCEAISSPGAQGMTPGLADDDSPGPP